MSLAADDWISVAIRIMMQIQVFLKEFLPLQDKAMMNCI